jgi:predicted  nucleic acid-binding Zn-ribbon protein
VDARRFLPFSLPRAGRWALGVLVLAAGLGFVPEYRTQAHVRRQAESANVQSVGKRLTEVVRRTLVEQPPALEAARKAIESTAELGDKLARSSLTRSEALRDLASAAERLNQELRQFGQNPALKTLDRTARDPGGAGNQSAEAMQSQMDALKKQLGNAAGHAEKMDQTRSGLQKAQQMAASLPDKDSPGGRAARQELAQALAQLSQQMSDHGQPLAGLDEAVKALERNQTDLVIRDLQSALTDLEKLRDMAKAMQQLQRQMARLGKDLAEQLEQGQVQAAQGTLQKMIRQLKASDLPPEALQKVMEEVARAAGPGQEYGKVGEHLQNAAQQMGRGQKPEAAESLANAARELERLAQQMADCQSLMDGLAALEYAQMAIGQGKSWDDLQGTGCKACGGAGCGKCRGGRSWNHGGGTGAGVGTWADETDIIQAEIRNQRVDNSGITRPDLDPRGLSDRDAARNPDLAPSKVRGQMGRGGPMPSITLKGVSIRGESTVRFEDAATAAQEEAQSALNQDRVPRAYQKAVRDYFDDLKK